MSAPPRVALLRFGQSIAAWFAQPWGMFRGQAFVFQPLMVYGLRLFSAPMHESLSVP